MTSKPAVIGGSIAAGVLVIAAIALRTGASPAGAAAVVAFMILAAIAAAGAMLFVRAFPERLGTFTGTFVVAVAATAPLFASGLLAGFPLVGSLWRRGDPSRHIVSAIVFIMFWLAIHLFRQVLATLAEKRVLAYVAKKIANPGRIDWGDLLPREFESRKTMAWQRLDLVLQQKMNPELAARLVAERAHTDDVALQSVYAPLRALVWALPAFGFIGTAATMARSISGIGSAVGGQGGSQQQLRALTDVVPNLGDAFNITLIALASTIVCFFALALVHAYEEKTMSQLQSLTVRLISAFEIAWPRTQNSDDPIGRLLTEMWSLQCEIARLRGPVAEFVRGNGSALTLAELLLRTTIELKALNETAAAHARALGKLSAAARTVKP